MRKLLMASLIAGMALPSLAESPLWLRNTAISPDGTAIAFTYKGDIYTVAPTGGDAVRLTSGGSYNSLPVWSKDSRKIAFTSDREGSTDIFIVDRTGGRPQRLTTHSGSEAPLTFLDNDHILFSASVMPSAVAANGHFFPQTYVVDTNGGRPSLYLSLPMRAADADGKGRILYQDRKGVEDALRKHEISSQTGDIWLYSDGKFSKLTDFAGSDQSPVWGAGDTYYYVSEEDGTLNVYENTIAGGAGKQLTNFKNHPVRSLSSSDTGILAFSWDGEIYTLIPGSQPQKLTVNIITDDYENSPAKKSQSSGAKNLAVSPDGESVAFILDGDVYVTSVEYKTTRRITDTPAQERSVSFSPDGRSIVYDSERDGVWQLFTTEIADKNEKSILYATSLIEKPVYKSDKPAFFPAYSPDGKKVAFLEDRTILRVLDLKSGDVVTALPGEFNYSYSDGDVGFEWSPDSRWLLINYIGVGGWNNQDVALVSADGSEVVDLTESGYSDYSPKWALDGKAMTWMSGKYGYKSHGSWGNESDAFIMFLDGDAYDKFKMTEEETKLAEKAETDAKDKDNKSDDKEKKGKKEKADTKKKDVEPLIFDLDNREFRNARLTASSSMLWDYYLSPKGDKLYYVASAPEGVNLYERDLKKGDTKTLVKNLKASEIVADKKGDNLFVVANSGITKVKLSDGSKKAVEFTAETTSSPRERREYIYDHMWHQVKNKFHDTNFHGADWDFYKDEYAKFLPYINNNYDFATLLSEILGELNASHTGGRYYASHGYTTANLGAFFDETYSGDGLKVKEVVKRGPLDYKNIDLKPGDIILAVNDSVIKAGQDYFPLLQNLGGKKVKLTVKSGGGKEKTVYTRPVNSLRDQMYQRWVRHNEHIVDSVSGGRVAYVHIQGMNSPSFRTVYDRLLGKYRNYDAVVVDTRHNGGGWLHNDVAQLLNGKEYVRYTPRGRYIGSDPFSQWTKPSVMLVDESNYSDAHGTPYVYQTLGIGDVVGAPVPGTMTAVWWETQIDPSLIFGIPQVTSLNMNGEMLENKQLNPDVVIYNAPGDVLEGIDAQLIGATRRVMEKIK